VIWWTIRQQKHKQTLKEKKEKKKDEKNSWFRSGRIPVLVLVLLL
jgi:hypothetical protein